jgi:chaperone required for assembly of F1-ATPase
VNGRRTYKKVVTVAAVGGGFTVVIDGQPLRTPLGHPLAVPTEALARAIADELAAQEKDIRPHTMPMTQLACTAIDRAGRERAALVEAVLRFAATDLLCYRAEEPEALVTRQRDAWQPLLDWAATDLDAPLRVTTGVVPVDQPATTIIALKATVEGLDDLALAALSAATAASGSLVIGLALVRGRLDAETAFTVSHLDETFQMERWGEDAEAAERRRAVRADLEAVARFLALARG